MKNKQILQFSTVMFLMAYLVGFSATSCSLMKKGNDLPAIGKSTALFDNLPA